MLQLWHDNLSPLIISPCRISVQPTKRVATQSQSGYYVSSATHKPKQIDHWSVSLGDHKSLCSDMIQADYFNSLCNYSTKDGLFVLGLRVNIVFFYLDSKTTFRLWVLLLDWLPSSNVSIMYDSKTIFRRVFSKSTRILLLDWHSSSKLFATQT